MKDFLVGFSVLVLALAALVWVYFGSELLRGGDARPDDLLQLLVEVTDAETHLPLAGARIDLAQRTRPEEEPEKYEVVSTQKSDAEGHARFRALVPREALVLLAEAEGHRRFRLDAPELWKRTRLEDGWLAVAASLEPEKPVPEPAEAGSGSEPPDAADGK